MKKNFVRILLVKKVKTDEFIEESHKYMDRNEYIGCLHGEMTKDKAYYKRNPTNHNKNYLKIILIVFVHTGEVLAESKRYLSYNEVLRLQREEIEKCQNIV